MSGTTFVSIVTENGIVTAVEGQISISLWGGGSLAFVGQKVNDVLNKCAKEGYEHFDTDVIGNKKIHRMKLSKV